MNELNAPHAGSLEELVGRIADEFTERLNCGEQPDVQEYVRLHPEIADILHEVLPALSQFRASVVEDDWPEGCPNTLGDFRLLRIVGRGGMGTVYEAEQLSLGRRVAVKVLPFAATLDARHLQRFRNEARAAALLHHTHIVPVFGMGSDRGVSYYAMQYIEGQTLAEVIAGISRDRAGAPSPKAPEPAAASARTLPGAALTTERSAGGPAYYRSVARLGVQAAEALEHAHELGVVHRDIKPGNLLLDNAGHLWITDFGLARMPDDPGLTRTGDVLGTLRYMSPEQALGNSTPANCRSDLYSLGATLYELLTLEPAYPGKNREELLQQIAAMEPKAPRRLDPEVPLELETVVLKAMAREPGRRYASAGELADDLRRFLEHRPVKARRPSITERMAKFARRHRAATTAAAGFLLLSMVGLGITTLLVWRETERTKAALAREEQQRRRAEANFQQALDGASQILLPLEDERLKGKPGMDELRQELVRRGARFFESFVHPESSDPAVRFESARAACNLAATYCAHQQVELAREKLHQAIALLEELVSEQPLNPVYRKQLAWTYSLSAALSTSLKQFEAAKEDYVRYGEQLRQVMSRETDADALNSFAWFLADCPEAALRDPARSVALGLQATERSPAVGAYWNTLGVAYYRSGQPRLAIAALEKSMALRKGGDAWDWFFLAMAYWQLDDRSAVERWYEKAVRQMDKMAPMPQDLLRYRAEADALLGKGKPAEKVEAAVSPGQKRSNGQ